MATIEQKYRFLLSCLVISDVDVWENDAYLKLERSLYFQFGKAGPGSVDEAVEAALASAKQDEQFEKQKHERTQTETKVRAGQKFKRVPKTTASK